MTLRSGFGKFGVAAAGGVATYVHIRAWGAGGGGSTAYTPGSGIAGGGGGYVEAHFVAAASQVVSFIIGTGGATDTPGPGDSTGGLFTGVLEGNSPATPGNHSKIIIAVGGGGGAGSYSDPGIQPSTPGFGGQGGTATGGAGGPGNNSGPGGGGGSQSAGGAGGGPDGDGDGAAGTTFTGGAGGHTGNQQGGGGGGGYYGGGGGAGDSTSGNGAGGGGGSSYVGGSPGHGVPTVVTNTGGASGAPSARPAPSTLSAGAPHPAYTAGIGIGGAQNASGGAGRIEVIQGGSVEQIYNSSSVNVSIPADWLTDP